MSPWRFKDLGQQEELWEGGEAPTAQCCRMSTLGKLQPRRMKPKRDQVGIYVVTVLLVGHGGNDSIPPSGTGINSYLGVTKSDKEFFTLGRAAAQ